MSSEVLVIVPTYNERENIEPLTQQVFEQLPDANVLVVDDASPDGTGQLADELAERDPRIAVLHRAGKLGLGTAYIAGFKYGLERDYQYMFEMDADFSHDPRFLQDLLSRARTDADLALGSRYIEGGGTVNWGLARQAISRGGNMYARAILGTHVSDMTGGFKCFRRQVLEAIDLDSIRSEGYSFQIEMTYRALQRGFKVVEVPIIFADRRVGQSKMSKAIVAEAMWMVWRIRLGLTGG
ncbi:MAG: dolichyl-phosphate beta-D-mannosyltransferase [Proteobacteria bacterium]|nr:MAG: dolichyl-phosphate beta-D-mannosyltransferase [Pseudomonadota bacterium]PIE18442.1 MAG: dolichyl-phosphate beta-D-mannosyltransferase [Pseudomonadota bacterium]